MTPAARPRRPVARAGHGPALMALLALLLVLAGCTSADGPRSPGPDADLARFVAALQAGKTDDAAALTSDPGSASQALDTVWHDLGPTRLTLRPDAVQHDGDATTASVAVQYAWQLPVVGSWTYRTQWQLTRRGVGDTARWSVNWAPAVIHPGLGARQTLVVRALDAAAGPLVDRNDVQLVTAQRVYSVVAAPRSIADPAATAAAVVELVSRYDRTVTAAAVAAGIEAADPDVGYTVINLREDEFRAVGEQLGRIRGLTFPSQVRALGPTKTFARSLLTQLTPVADRLSAGRDGWQIVSVDAAGAEVATLASAPPDPGRKTILTLDRNLQLAAERALASASEPAVLVAIQPSTGEILTVAQNPAADALGPIALTGRYPPGSIFKIVTATAAIDARLAGPTTTVPCPGTWTVDDRPIRNEYEFDLGRVPLSLAFAKSCNTTFAQLATELPADALTRAAVQYGIGADFVVPGITTLTGAAPAASDTVQRAEDGFGQGKVLVTPFSAALMAATAATGSMPVPTLVRGQKTTVDRTVPPRSAAARSGVATLMDAVVQEGTAQTLQSVARGSVTVHAKTGTAEYTDAQGELHAHAWTVGYRGDLAFSVLIVGGDSSKRTNLIAKAFLAAAP